MNEFFKMIYPDHEDFNGKTAAVIGAGGKTSLLDILGRELSGFNLHVLVTSLTKSEIDDSKQIFTFEDFRWEGLSRLFRANNPLYMMKSLGEGGKYIGYNSSELIPMLPECGVCLIEGDGARKLSLKAHTEDDPIVPDFADKLIIIAGADVVNTRLSDGLVHRPELFGERWGISGDSILNADLISEVLVSENGYQQKNTAGIATTYFINKADNFPVQAEELAGVVYEKTGRPVYYGSLTERFYRRVS